MCKGWPILRLALATLIWSGLSWSSTTADWTFKIRLLGPQFKDQENYVGVWQGCRDGLDPADAQEPPALPGRPNLASIPPDGSDPLGMDLREPVPAVRSWAMLASFLQPEVPHTLAFDYVSDVPSECLVEFKDMATGEILDLRTHSEYVFLSSPGETSRQFMVIVTYPLPAPPDNLELTRSKTSGSVSWSPSNSLDVVGYVVYLGTSPYNVEGSWYVNDGLTYAFGGLEQNQRYYVAVSSVDSQLREGAVSKWYRLVSNSVKFDISSSGTMERSDVFLLAANWMKPVSAKTSEGGTLMVSVDGKFLHGFVQCWCDSRSSFVDPKEDLSDGLPGIDFDFLEDFVQLTDASSN